MASPRLLPFWATSLAALLAVTAYAAPTPQEILEASDRARGQLPGIVWTVDLTAREGTRETSQTLEVSASGDKALVKVLEPPRVRGQMMLFAGRNLWFIKPGVSKAVPISPRQKMMGQAANGDIASTNYAGDYEGALRGFEEIDGERCYVLELTARVKNVTYDRITYWVSVARQVGVRADFFTVSGKRLKSASFAYDNAIAYQGKTIPFVSRMVIRDALEADNQTTIDYTKVRVEPVPEATFNLSLILR